MTLPLSCDVIHFLMGFLTGLLTRSHLRRWMVGTFVVYQAIEELGLGDVLSFTKDVTVFSVGLVSGCMLGLLLVRPTHSRPTQVCHA